MLFLRRRIKEQHFFTYNTREIDIKGLSVTLKGIELPDINFGLGSLYIKPERQDVIDSLKQLDLLQYSLSRTVNAIDDKKTRDQELKKIIDAQIEMFKLTAKYMREDAVNADSTDDIGVSTTGE